MRAGTLIEYQLQLYGVRFRWQTRIEEFDPPRSFVDSQLKGPYQRWVHRHTFEDALGGTLMRDRVEYALGMGPLGALAHRLWVRRSVERIFEYRSEAIPEIIGS